MTGYANTGYGYAALYSNTSGWGNTASGTAALAQNTTGHYNTGNGSHALAQNTIGSDNTADGYFALFYNTNDGNNIALGYQAGINIQGNNNIDVGNQGMGGDNNTIRIGTSGTHTNTFIAGISGVTVPNAANPVVVDSVSGQLGTVDISTLVGPTGATGAQGPAGPQGPAGVNGVNGVGFVTGAYLYLPATTVAPDGFTKIGTKTDFITDLHGRTKILKMNVYQKI